MPPYPTIPPNYQPPQQRQELFMNYQSIDWAPVPGFVLVGREAREYMQEDYEELSFVLLGVDGRTYVCYEDCCCLPQEQETVVQVRLDGQVVETYHMPGVGSDLKGIRKLPSALAILFPYFYVLQIHPTRPIPTFKIPKPIFSPSGN